MKSLLLFLIFLFSACTLRAQKYFFPQVDGTESEIRSYMVQMGGQIKVEKLMVATFSTPAHKQLDYVLPKTDENDIYFANFFFDKKGVCFQQNLWYGSDKFLNYFINLFNTSPIGWKRMGESFKWERANLEAEIVSNSKTTAFILQLKKKRLDKDAEWVHIKPFKQ
jgi:hypothetical protein